MFACLSPRQRTRRSARVRHRPPPLRSRCRSRPSVPPADSGAIDAVILRERTSTMPPTSSSLRRWRHLRALRHRLRRALHVEAARRLGCAAVPALPLLRAQGRPTGSRRWVRTSEADEVARPRFWEPTFSSRAPCSRLRCKPASTARGCPSCAVLDRAHAPVFALGGITDENERLIREAGAAGACRMSDYARRRGRSATAPCKYERSRG